MPNKPVIEIEINDSNFKRFYDLFQDYSSKLADMPDDWKRVQKALDSATKSLGKSFFGEHERGFLQGSKEMRLLAERLTVAHKAQKVFAAETGQLGKNFQFLAKQGTSFLSNMTSGVGGLTRAASGLGDSMGGIAGAVGAAVAAIGAAIAGIDKLGEAAQSQTYARRLTGSSTGKMAAFGNVYQNIFGGESAAENFVSRVSLARMNPQQLSAFAMLGLSKDALNPKIGGVELAEKVASRLSQFAKQHKGNLMAMSQIAQASGLASLLPGGTSDLMQFANRRGVPFDEMQKRVNALAASMNVTPKQQAQLRKFHQTISGTGEQIYAHVERGAAALVSTPESTIAKVATTGILPELVHHFPEYKKEFSRDFPYVTHLLRRFGSALEGVIGKLEGEKSGTGKSRANNLGNIRDPKTGKFLTFATPQEGALAMAHQLRLDIGKHQQDTLQKLIYGNRLHAGWTSTQRAAELKNITKLMGIGPNDKLTDAMLPRLMAALATAEGHRGYNANAMASYIGFHSMPANRASQGANVHLRVENSTSARVAVQGAIAAGVGP